MITKEAEDRPAQDVAETPVDLKEARYHSVKAIAARMVAQMFFVKAESSFKHSYRIAFTIQSLTRRALSTSR